MTNKNFNIRVYGILISNDKILINEETVHGNKKIIKFPGGGMEYGEGTKQCLVREWKEELDIEIGVGHHFYTTDFFQQSAFDDSQIISIYYWVHVDEPIDIENKFPNERTFWMDVSEVGEHVFTLPIDKVVGSMLCDYFSI